MSSGLAGCEASSINGIVGNIKNIVVMAASLAGSWKNAEARAGMSPANSLACSGLGARLMSEQRLLSSRDGSGPWWAQLSSETLYNKWATTQPSTSKLHRYAQ